jgi:hypothetical protein
MMKYLRKTGLNTSPRQMSSSKEISGGKKKKKVQFANGNTNVHVIEYPADLSEFWYEPQDQLLFKMRFQPLLQKAAWGDDIPEDEYQTTRGLENLTQSGMIRHQSNLATAKRSVLALQAQLKRTGVVNEEAIAEAYKRSTAHCQLAACELARGDSEYAKKHCNLKWCQHTVSLRMEGVARQPQVASASNQINLVPVQKYDQRKRASARTPPALAFGRGESFYQKVVSTAA